MKTNRRSFIKGILAAAPVTAISLPKEAEANDAKDDTFESMCKEFYSLCEEFDFTAVGDDKPNRKAHYFRGIDHVVMIERQEICRYIILEINGKAMPLRGQFIIANAFVNSVLEWQKIRRQ